MLIIKKLFLYMEIKIKEEKHNTYSYIKSDKHPFFWYNNIEEFYDHKLP